MKSQKLIRAIKNIENTMRPMQWYSFNDVERELGFIGTGSGENRRIHHRAWLELLHAGRFTESVDGRYKLNI